MATRVQRETALWPAAHFLPLATNECLQSRNTHTLLSKPEVLLGLAAPGVRGGAGGQGLCEGGGQS